MLHEFIWIAVFCISIILTCKHFLFLCKSLLCVCVCAMCNHKRLPKVKHGRILLPYWASVQVAVQHIRCASITLKIYWPTSVISIVVILILCLLSNKLKLVLRRNRLKLLRYHHQVINVCVQIDLQVSIS